ncbi:exodeoxyribonuclease V subunit beta [Noviherbaspirillum aridicola]|uniref:RecBCD enzyme subunit RecB n=1 Tax=Noviherbaspirillum aridicola TaxID=2849687 RepID=A0ABQ4Q9F2_9BURK|nr:exodeoxyribonuclease V subunit beta [Noviherbaspirillum aridicola]GIZ53694.1 RecBCD enzyme subunit RecB [Noviherbaspirillum aridicola]
MSQDLDPLRFPLHGSRLIEASAGTGKTWTIAALYVRLVLGHGGGDGFCRPLLPSEILVMTFTRAATRELSDRIRQRLVQAARCFRGESEADDCFLRALLVDYPDTARRSEAAHRLALAAEAMDDAGIFTIDAWCQRMLREHAFDSGSLFNEELVGSEDAVFAEAVRDYWRRHVYALDDGGLRRLQECWPDFHALESTIRPLVERVHLLGDAGEESLAALIRRAWSEQQQAAAALKAGWADRIADMEAWILANRKALDGNKLRNATVEKCMAALRAWAEDEQALQPGPVPDGAWARLTPSGLAQVCKDKSLVPPAVFAEHEALHAALAEIQPPGPRLMQHAACAIARRIAQIKQRRRQFGFADMLARLRAALEGANRDALRARIVAQYPVALIDEFQDTSPDQYRIFDLLYRVRDNEPRCGLFLIGDPKQAIYGFRGADIHSYLDARRATEGRHYRLGTNFRSTGALVRAVNHVFLHAEGDGDGRPGHPAGAFRFRRGGDNPLPFEPVGAQGRKERLVRGAVPAPALTMWCNRTDGLNAESYRAHFAALCAEEIVALLSDPDAGFESEEGFRRLRPADIAILVRSRSEAAAVRLALRRREVKSVYLSDKDSVYRTEEAADVLRWLRAVASPVDSGLARAAFATRSAGLSLAALAELAADDLAWEARVEQLKGLRLVWQRQGVLAMLRRFIHELDLPARLLGGADGSGGERRLTDLLHLAELLQAASQKLDGEQALIRWLADQIEHDSEGGDERILRLESDAELVKVVTVHKSKGLEYPLVFLPFGVTATRVEKRRHSFYEFVDADGRRHLDFALTEEARQKMDDARLDEDLRLFYVALTRARHALWIGVASLRKELHRAALGYLMQGGEEIGEGALMSALETLCRGCDAIALEDRSEMPGISLLAARGEENLLRAALPRYDAGFERNWGIASYTSITRDVGAMPAPVSAAEEKLIDQDDSELSSAPEDTPWHRFPRGSLPGQFLHAQMEWMAAEGFVCARDDGFADMLLRRCERAGWAHRGEDAVTWLRAVATTALPPLGTALADLGTAWPEMEFWLPADGLDTGALDALCREHLLGGRARPALQQRALQGMLRGFQDLVFEHDGRYWVLDYKSNALGRGDAAYHAGALEEAIAVHRYDVQGLIYLLALHRLLRARLGAGYDPAACLGGAVFFFMRGIGNAATRGCSLLAPAPDLLEQADALFADALAGVSE